MPYGIVHFFEGGTKEQYDASIAVVHPRRGAMPEGQIYHAAGPTQGGWQIIAIHDSRQSWEKFRDQVLMPKFKAGIPGGFANLPQERGFEIYNLLSLRNSEREPEMHP